MKIVILKQPSVRGAKLFGAKIMNNGVTLAYATSVEAARLLAPGAPEVDA